MEDLYFSLRHFSVWSFLGKGDPKSGQIAGLLNRQPHLKSRHSRTYAIGSEWHATWLFNRDNHGESPQLVSGGNDGAACLAFRYLPETRGRRLMTNLLQDLRYGARMLIKHEGLTIIAAGHVPAGASNAGSR